MTEKNSGLMDYFHSMRLHIAVIVLLAGVCCAAAFFLTSSLYTRMRSLGLKNDAVADDISKLADKMSRNAYTATYTLNSDITRELELLAFFYDGRITVTDSNLMVIFDSYGLGTGNGGVARCSIAYWELKHFITTP